VAESGYPFSYYSPDFNVRFTPESGHWAIIGLKGR
jgi:hypothetical protein